jgi:adenosylcobinamide kinase/adenosylcobinamide-phosphate guanylyltransferase
MAQLIFILGGARSGKSRFAQQLAQRLGGEDVLFVATAAASDSEMEARIARHRADRPRGWQTLEAPTDLAARLADRAAAPRVILIDCLTLLISNVLLAVGEYDADRAERKVEAEIGALLDLCSNREGTVLLVSNEVGEGVVPAYPLGRLFRDVQGKVNQMVAARSDCTYLMVAGLAVEMKALAIGVEAAADQINREG